MEKIEIQENNLDWINFSGLCLAYYIQKAMIFKIKQVCYQLLAWISYLASLSFSSFAKQSFKGLGGMSSEPGTLYMAIGMLYKLVTLFYFLISNCS